MARRRIFPLVLVLVGATASPALAGERGELRDSLAEAMSSTGRESGAYVRDARADEALFRKRAAARRILASNTKLFTTAAVLDSFSGDERLSTTVLGDGSLDAAGDWNGDLYLRGGGDPTFGSSSEAAGAASDATPARLARRVGRAGIAEVRGRIVGDESLFDSLRGGPGSGYETSGHVGPLSALIYDRGRDGGGFQADPPKFAARELKRALENRGVEVDGRPRADAAPSGLDELAAVASPSVAALVKLTNKPSDNLSAELLAKGLGVRVAGDGSTAAGAEVATDHARELGAQPRLVDGSGLARSNRAAPVDVGRLLDGMRDQPQFEPFFDSLPVAGRDGTLSQRMRAGPARDRCRAKTGTLPGVSTLSGYCRSKGGDPLVFSFLMNGVDTQSARDLQDRMTQALARYRG